MHTFPINDAASLPVPPGPATLHIHININGDLTCEASPVGAATWVPVKTGMVSGLYALETAAGLQYRLRLINGVGGEVTFANK
jgi:hypothetical protein